MEQAYWQKQTSQPLFPELDWSRPEHKAQAGKLLIIGGNSQGFAAPAEAYAAAIQAGVGTSRVILPAALQKTVGKLFPEAEFAPTNPSGGFASNALAELLDASQWANGALLAGAIGHNSETTALLENFAETYHGPLSLTADIADHFCSSPQGILQRPETLLVISLGQLQKLGSSAKFSRAFTHTMGLVQLAETLHEFTERFSLYIVIKQADTLVVAVAGRISTTKPLQDTPIWRVRTAAYMTVWWLQNQAQPFEALTTAALS